MTDSHIGTPPPAPDAGLRRLLEIAVAGMGVLIVAGLAAVALRVAYLAAHSGGAAAAEAALALPSGASVKSLSLSGQRLAVHYVSPEGEGIGIVDLETGRLVSRLRLVPEPAAGK